MFQKVATLFLACLFLTGSTLLPLSDFALMQDLPNMYRNYSNITTSEELGVIDFVGDYLLHGKEIFGHNDHDKPQSGDNSVQFQHQANALNVVFLHLSLIMFVVPESCTEHFISKQTFCTSDYQNNLFRPPLT